MEYLVIVFDNGLGKNSSRINQITNTNEDTKYRNFISNNDSDNSTK